MAQNHLVLRGLSFAYPSSSAHLFEDLTMQFESGWTGIVGPNGLGKTTLLRLLAGELEPNIGKIDRRGSVALKSAVSGHRRTHLVLR